MTRYQCKNCTKNGDCYSDEKCDDFIPTENYTKSIRYAYHTSLMRKYRELNEFSDWLKKNHNIHIKKKIKEYLDIEKEELKEEYDYLDDYDYSYDKTS